jgi:hypothetical protein
MRVVRRNVSPSYAKAAALARVSAERGHEAEASPPSIRAVAVKPRDRG